VSSQVSLFNQNGSSVTFGNLLLILIEKFAAPCGPSRVVRPEPPAPRATVIVAYEDQDGSADSIRVTLRLALQELFPSVPKSVFDGVVARRRPSPRPRCSSTGPTARQHGRHDYDHHHAEHVDPSTGEPSDGRRADQQAVQPAQHGPANYPPARRRL
jgi:uncharacterized membrane protein (UPF0182 family)